jgi:hypothetical protein
MKELKEKCLSCGLKHEKVECIGRGKGKIKWECRNTLKHI